MDFTKPVNAYCERLAHGLWQEPVNLFSNAFFLICGIILISKAKNTPNHKELKIIGVMIFVVGIGSGLFHSFANVWSQLADIIPIGLLVLVYIYFFTQKVLRLSLMGVISIYTLLAAYTSLVIFTISREATNGSRDYFGVALIMVTLGFIDFRLNRSKTLLYGFCVFALSLTFRSIDNALCVFNPVGTHFMWHTLNALMLYILGMRFIKK